MYCQSRMAPARPWPSYRLRQTPAVPPVDHRWRSFFLPDALKFARLRPKLGAWIKMI